MVEPERAIVYQLEIPQIGFFLLVCRGVVMYSNDMENYLRELFDDKQIIIKEIPDILVIYKEIVIENVWITNDTRAHTYKLSKNGIAVLAGTWLNKEERIKLKENFEKFFRS